MLDRVCGKRYPRARINRILTRAALGITPEMLEGLPHHREALLLGMRPNPEMTGDWKARDIQVRSNIKDMPADPAFSLWGQCAGLGEDWAYREKTVKG